VIDEKPPAYASARVDLNAGEKTGDLRKETGQNRHARLVQAMREPVKKNRVKTWVTEENLQDARCCRVFPKDGVDLFPDGGKHTNEMKLSDLRLRLFPE
jgi:hypothetical protein